MASDARIIWGEMLRSDGRRLVPVAGGDSQFLAATLAYFLLTHGPQDFSNLAPAPRADDPDAVAQYGALVTFLARADVRNGNLNGTALPKRAVLWEVENGKPVETKYALPVSARWILDKQVAVEGDYCAAGDPNGPVYRLYTSDAPPEGPPFVSSITSTGLAVAKRPRSLWPWIIGLVGGIGFIVVALNLSHTANALSEAYDLLDGRQANSMISFVTDLQRPACANDAAAAQTDFCQTAAESLTDTGKAKKGDALRQALDEREKRVGGAGSTCLARFVSQADATRKEEIAAANKEAKQATPAPGPADVAIDRGCADLIQAAADFASRHLVYKADNTIESMLQPVLYYLFAWQMPTNGVQLVSLAWPLALMMAGVIAVLVGLGLGVTGKPLGALISAQNRYSLALAQVTFWTVLILTSMVGIAIFNAGLVAQHMRPLAASDMNVASEAIKNGFFPSIPNPIWAVLGITFGSSALSTLIKRLRGSVDESDIGFSVSGAAAADDGIHFFKDKPLAARADTRRASIADWFLGEDTDNLDRIDITRVQMVLMTIGLLVTYAEAIFALVSDLSIQGILLNIHQVSVLIAGLPSVGASMAVILAASHATYLLAKTADSPTGVALPKK